MIEFKQYYKNQFQQDIIRFISAIPERNRHTFGDKSTYTIQYQALTLDFHYLDFLDIKVKAYFATALFFTVLVDQICYSYYKPYYLEFRNLTLYPKFVGNSPSTDQTNFHPSDIFAAINYSRDTNKKNQTQKVEFWDIFNEAVEPMKNEIVDFFVRNLSEINGNEFWEKCKKEFPYTLKTEMNNF